jgi:transketolase
MRKTGLDSVHNLAKSDNRVVFVGSDLGAGVLEAMRQELPSQWFMEGVSEQHIIGLAAGLAMEGFIPYVNTIATFLTRRCYEQISIDVGLHRLPVRLIGNGGGVVYAPLGPTHQAIDDIAIMRAIPNMTVIAPCDAWEMEKVIKASLDWRDPIYIRVAKGGDEKVGHNLADLEIGKGIMIRDGVDAAFVSTGVMTQRALAASRQLEELGVDCGVLHFHTLKPLDTDLLREVSEKTKVLITIEEHMRTGGLGSIVLETINDLRISRVPEVIRLGLPDMFAGDYGSQDSLLNQAGLNWQSLVSVVCNAVGR